MTRMKVFIEDMERALFLTSAGMWTPFQELAHDFQTIITACQVCSRRPEPQACVYLAFGNPRYDTRLDRRLFNRPPAFQPAQVPKPLISPATPVTQNSKTDPLA